MAIIGTAGLAVGVRSVRFALRRAGFRRTIEILRAVPMPLGRKTPIPGDPTAWAKRMSEQQTDPVYQFGQVAEIPEVLEGCLGSRVC